jgi:subtilisin family serine protease
MSDFDDGTTDVPPAEDFLPFVPDDRDWTTDVDLQRERLQDQLQIILDSLPGAQVFNGKGDAPTPPDRFGPGDPQYLYRGGIILIRDADLDRVHAILGGDEPPQARVDPDLVGDQPMNGLTPYSVPDGDTTAALEAVDAALGVGVATPDHVLYVTPSKAGCCPATEPQQPGQDNPDPDVNRDPATSGNGVLVSVVDTGLLPDLTTSEKQPWLHGVGGDPETIDVRQLRHYVGNGGAVYESAIVRQLGEALVYAPDIISLSAGTWTRHSLPLLGFEVFYETRLRHYQGTVLVAAAGNDGNRGPFWPAAFPWALSVGALDAGSAGRAPYSNFGSWVDVYARGSDMVNAFPNGVYRYAEAPHKGQSAIFDRGMANWSGTSFATPLVSGLIAARMSRTGESAHDAAQALRALAGTRAIPGVGPTLAPGMASL